MKNLFIKLAVIAIITASSGISTANSAPNPDALKPGNHTFKLKSGNRDRSYVLHIPKNHDPAKALPLVLAFHGGGGNAQNMESMTGFSAKSDREGFIVCYPNGTGVLPNSLLTWNTGNCCGYALDNKVDDVAFIDAMLDDVGTKARIDWDRVYATGISNGGMMSYLLGCRLAHRFAAIAPVAGAMNIDCQPNDYVSACIIHGTGDLHVLYDGGKPKKTVDTSHPREDKSVQHAIDTLSALNGIDKSIVSKAKLFPKVERWNFPEGTKGSRLVHYKLTDFGHAWPGGLKYAASADDTKCDISATDTIWDFFKSCRKTNPLRQAKYWACQYDNLDNPESIKALEQSKYDLLVIDRFSSVKGSESFADKSTVGRLRKAGKKVLCYVNIGEAENYRAYWQDGWKIGNPSWILANDPDGWDGNFPVMFWHPEWQNILMERAFIPAINDGFDGFYLDWVEIYDNEQVKKQAESLKIDTLARLGNLINNIRVPLEKLKPDVAIVCQNASELGSNPAIIKNFDAISQESVWFKWTGDPDKPNAQVDVEVLAKTSSLLIGELKLWQKQGKPVFTLEYCQKPENTSRVWRWAEKNGFSSYVAPVQLDRLSNAVPWSKKLDYMEITVDKLSRSFFVYLPDGFSSKKQYPAIFVLHGGAGNAIKTMNSTDMLKKADREGFVAVFPNGLGSGGVQGWNAGKCCGEGQKKGADDAKFLSTVASTLNLWNVAKSNIFVCGISNGGMMCYMLACKTAGIFAGYASIAGNLMVDGKPAKPVPFMEIHSTDDRAVPYNGGGIHLSVEKSLKVIRDANKCKQDASITKGKLGSQKTVWKGEKDAVLWKLADGGHSWPGLSGKSSKAIIATDEIWSFLSSYITN